METKHLLTLFALVLFPLLLNCQEIAIAHIVPAGGFEKIGNGVSLNWSLGQVFDTTIEEEANHLTEGFQQGEYSPENEMLIGPNQNNFENISFSGSAPEIQVFPNPTSDYLKINFGENKSENIVVNIYDMSGILLFNKKYSDSNNQLISINIKMLLKTGNYIIQIIGDDKLTDAKKFEKI